MAREVWNFSKWNERPWWARAGYRSADEAWADFSRAQREFAPEAFKNMEHQQRMVRELNSKRS